MQVTKKATRRIQKSKRKWRTNDRATGNKSGTQGAQEGWGKRHRRSRMNQQRVKEKQYTRASKQMKHRLTQKKGGEVGKDREWKEI